MSKSLKVYENVLWELFDQGSKVEVLTILIEAKITGLVKLVVVPKGDSTEINILNGKDEVLMTLPIDVFSLLNE